MHGNQAAGKLTAMDFDDASKTIPVTIKVVDPVDRLKCEEGVYTGVSIGGHYVDRWQDPATKLLRYEAKPIEVSLVDEPCMYGSTFKLLKGAGRPEDRTFKGAEAEAKPDAEPDLTKGDPESDAATAQAAAVKLEDIIPKLQEVLVAFSMLPPDRTSYELHELIDAMDRLRSAASSARFIAADALQEAAAAEGAEKVSKADTPAATPPEPPAALGGVLGEGLMKLFDRIKGAEAELAKLPTLLKEAEDRVLAGVEERCAKIVEKMKTQFDEVANKHQEFLEALKGKADEAATKAALTEQKESVGQLMADKKTLGELVDTISRTPAAMGRPAQPAEKVLGDLPKEKAEATPESICEYLLANKAKMDDATFKKLYMDVVVKAMP